MVCRNLRQAYLQEVGLTQISWDHFFIFIFTSAWQISCRFLSRFLNRFQDWQIPPSSSLKLVEFETKYIKPNHPSSYANKICNGPATWSILTSHYAWGSMTTLKRLSQHPCYGLWMRVKGPHHYKVTSQEPWPWTCESPKETIQKHVVWSRILKWNEVWGHMWPGVNQNLFQYISIHMGLSHMLNRVYLRFGYGVKPTSERWFLKIVQVTMKHDLLDAL